MLAYKLKSGQLFMAKQLARLGNQEKTFSCSLCYSLAPGKRASVKLHHWYSTSKFNYLFFDIPCTTNKFCQYFQEL